MKRQKLFFSARSIESYLHPVGLCQSQTCFSLRQQGTFFFL